MNSITIELPLPHSSLSPNARAHWAVKSKYAKISRTSAGWETLAAMWTIGVDPPRWERATVKCWFYFATKRRRDIDNCIGSCKSIYDGIADAGIVANDCGFIHLPAELLVDKISPRVVIQITKVEE